MVRKNVFFQQFILSRFRAVEWVKKYGNSIRYEESFWPSAPKAKILKIYTISVQSGKMVETATATVYTMKKVPGARSKDFFNIYTILIYGGKIVEASAEHYRL